MTEQEPTPFASNNSTVRIISNSTIFALFTVWLSKVHLSAKTNGMSGLISRKTNQLRLQKSFLGGARWRKGGGKSRNRGSGANWVTACGGGGVWKLCAYQSER